MRKLSLILGEFVLVMTTLAIIGAILLTHEPTRDEPLALTIPDSIKGWNAEDRALGDNDFAKELAEVVLKYDDYVYRIYQRRNIDFRVYIAYWKPHKTQPRLIHRHTPDICWIKNGWTQDFYENDLQKSLNHKLLKGGSYRIFKKEPSETQYVLFWHLVGGKVFQHEDLNRYQAILKDLHQWGFQQNREQYFIRIQCNVPFEAIWEDPSIQDILKSVASLGLYKD